MTTLRQENHDPNKEMQKAVEFRSRDITTSTSSHSEPENATVNITTVKPFYSTNSTVRFQQMGYHVHSMYSQFHSSHRRYESTNFLHASELCPEKLIIAKSSFDEDRGELTLCGDDCVLNQITELDSYPLPHTTKIFSAKLT